MQQRKPGGKRAHWDSRTVHFFCDLCIREIDRGNRPGTHLTGAGWRNLIRGFKDQTGKEYEKWQLKYRWDLLKRDWFTWRQLVEGESVVGGSDEWWEEKLKVIPEAKKFRDHGIEPELEEKLDKMFNVIGDLEEYASVPSDADDLDKPKMRKRRKSGEINSKSENEILLLEYSTEKPDTPKTNEPSKRRKSERVGNFEEKSRKMESVPQNDNAVSDIVETKSTDTWIKQCGTKKLIERTDLEEKSEKLALIPQNNSTVPDLVVSKSTFTSIKPCETKKLIERTNLEENSQNLALIPQNNNTVPDLVEIRSTGTSIKPCETKKMIEQTNSVEKSPKLALIPQKDNPIPDLIETKSTANSIKPCETCNCLSNCSITDAIRLLDSLNEVPKASPLYYFAIKLILNRDKREVFMALTPEIKVWWLKMEESESRK